MEYKEARQYAIRRLAAKSYSSGELAQLFKRRLIPEDIAQRVIEEFQRLGYINDTEWIASFVRSQWARNTGPKAIVMKLRAKGVSEDVAEDAVQKVSNGDAQQEKIRGLISTKYRTRDLSDFKDRQKVIASLLRKGFDYEDVAAALCCD